ncbi:OmpA family protein [Methylobacterium sp. 17Sr1-1]|nr:OmpA family protein [Methylobacterium sp. 17Sr1-1]
MRKIALTAGSLLMMNSMFCFSALTQELTAPEIACKLDPTCPKTKMRGLRGIKVSGDSIADPPNSASFHINFKYDSADLETDSLITLDQIGAALRDDRLRTYKFSIVGHTDAKGSDAYNQSLSERRANSVREYLTSKFSISPSLITAKGYGKSHLLDPARPEDGVNRRVQVVTDVDHLSR